MLIIRKKNVLHELAVCLYLMLEFNPDTTARSLINRIQERAKTALESARSYTGIIGETNVHSFLTAKPLKFSIDCGRDIVKGDFIRFIEHVYDNRRRPPRHLGERGIIAEVIGNSAKQDNSLLHLRVISCGGVWNIAADTEIFRTLKIVTRTEVMRAPWEDEPKRNKHDDNTDKTPHDIKSAKIQLTIPHNKPKSK